MTNGYKSLGTSSRRRTATAYLLVPLYGLAYFREFPGPDGPVEATLFLSKAGGFRVVDLALLAYCAAILILVPTRAAPARLPSELLIPACLGLGAVLLAVINGATLGGRELFYDWRALLCGVLITFVTVRLVRDERGIRSAAHILMLMGSTASVLMLVGFFIGASGTSASQTGAVPVFDGPILVVSSLVAAVGLAFISSPGVAPRFLPFIAASSSLLVISLSFRRTAWLSIPLVFMVLLMTGRKDRTRVRLVGLALLLTLTVILALPSGQLIGRLQSFDITSTDPEFAATNRDHVNDLLDAWAQIRSDPILGKGLGTSYQTDLIRRWKAESWQVHNALLHTWLFYGILGLVAYLWWWLALIRRMWQEARADRSPLLTVVNRGLLAWTATAFTISATFAPSYFSFLQIMVPMGIVWGLCLRSWQLGRSSAIVRHDAALHSVPGSLRR